MAVQEDMRDIVRRAYGQVAQRQASCCGPAPTCCGPAASCCEDGTASAQPVAEAELGLSCGDPVAFAEVREGDVVLDLGSGGGKDVFAAAVKAGPTGRAIGVDMTPEMLDLARRNTGAFTAATGLANVEFREGTIEDLPVEEGAVDLVISNCVINLSPDKARVFREVYRVLRPGGRMVVSDIVLERPLPEAVKTDTLFVACIAGALLRAAYLDAIRSAGFERVTLLTDRVYEGAGSCCDPLTAGVSAELAGAAASITVRAEKPAAGSE